MANEITVDLSKFKLDKRKKNIKQNLNKATKTAALYLEKPLKQECPVDTGTMMRSIGTKSESGDGWFDSVGDEVTTWLCTCGVEYAPYVIYGTSKQDANNFPARVVKNEKDKVTDIIVSTIRK